jgi:hypothetical protein
MPEDAAPETSDSDDLSILLARREAPMSWRDVSKQVEYMRAEVVGQVSGLSTAVNALSQNMEHRLTALETIQANHSTLIVGFTDRLGKVEDRLVRDESATGAVKAQEERNAAWRRWLVGAVLSFALVAVSLVAILR